ncbi:MAG: MBL fold metallo-hydrolase [Coriobacteriales bacterium]
MRWSDIVEERRQAKLADEVLRAQALASDGKASLVFMGTGAACGVPTFYCGCKACEEARVNPRARRTCCSIALVGTGLGPGGDAPVTLIDACPDVHAQLAREGIEDVERVLFTHEHFDHVGGVPQLELYVRLKRKEPLPFYCNEQTLAHIAEHDAFMADTFDLRPLALGETLAFGGISYTPIAATHCPGCFGYLIEVSPEASRTGRSVRIAYLPDTAYPCPETFYAIEGADILIVDATFNAGNWMPTQHLSIDKAIELADELGVGHCYLTHLSMQFDEPITLEELDAKLAAHGTRTTAAYDGLRIDL